ncbi:uncharacterized protein LOC143497901 [Brachyhypopomus gauderio]|uniref:uncharacterized protein LOC143497901 n=1 Tax=Brachyhypopomus gauderio TaxID=698409 RepID=UPI0040423D08
MTLYKAKSYKVRKVVKAAKGRYRDKVEFHLGDRDNRRLWQGLRTITDFHKQTHTSTITDPSLVEDLNTFYARIEVSTEYANAVSIASLASNANATMACNLTSEDRPVTISESDVRKALKQVNSRKAAGPDGIPGRVLKSCADQLAPVFITIINLSLTHSIVPRCFKKSDAIAYILHTILTHLDNGKGNYAHLLFVDYSSAFNTIVPSRLVMKLCDLGLNHSLCSWVQSFLTDRPQVVKMGNFTSSSKTLSIGAPQGCVLSPLLYSLYTHDCTATHSSNTIVKFADDTVVIDLISNNDEKAYLSVLEQL